MTAAAGSAAAGPGGQDVDLAGVAGLAAGDLPQLQHAAFMLAFADGQADGGVGEVVLARAAVVAGASWRWLNASPGRSGMSLPVSFLR